MFVLLGSLVAGVHPINLVQGNFFPDPGPDLPRIYIRNDGSIEPATAPIERAGSLYRLTHDIVMYTIEIQRDNLYFDGSGCLIQGNQSWMGIAPRHGDAGNNANHNRQKQHYYHKRKIKKCTTGVRIYNSTNIKITRQQDHKPSPGLALPWELAIMSLHLIVEDKYFVAFQVQLTPATEQAI